VLLAAVNVPLTVAEPVDVSVVAVVEPNVAPLVDVIPAAVIEPVAVSVVTVVEPAFIVPVVLTLIVPDKSAVLIEPSAICALLTESAPGVAGTFVSCDPSPMNPVAVTVPTTCSVVAGVVVPMPTLPDVVAMVAVPVIARVDAVAEPVTAIVFAVIEPPLPMVTPVSPSLVTCIRYDEPGVVVPMPNLVLT